MEKLASELLEATPYYGAFYVAGRCFSADVGIAEVLYWHQRMTARFDCLPGTSDLLGRLSEFVRAFDAAATPHRKLPDKGIWLAAAELAPEEFFFRSTQAIANGALAGVFLVEMYEAISPSPDFRTDLYPYITHVAEQARKDNIKTPSRTKWLLDVCRELAEKGFPELAIPEKPKLVSVPADALVGPGGKPLA